MLHRTRFILPVFTLLISLFTLQPSHAATINLPASGQTKCYDTAGTEITCAGTGQDGDKKMGVTWDEATRFSNNGNGTVTDNLTGLIWLQNANCTDIVGGIDKASGYLTWANALTWSNSLSSGVCGLTDSSSAGDWRLPNITELESLVDAQRANPSLSTGHPFVAVQAYYWSSTTYAHYTGYAWIVYMVDGYVFNYNKTNDYDVWPVRGGQ
jgi:hypothetical protein